MKRLYHSITNRMYCEYYKLYQIIVKYTEQVVKDKKVTDVVNSNSNFPKYHDLEPYKQYGTETITQIHDVIMLLFSNVKNVLDKKHEELNVHRAKNKIGINIDNFIQAFHFEIMIMEQKLMLFISYMEFFHKMNIKYLKRFTSKMNLFSSQIDHDIRIDSNSKTKERRKSMMEEFKHDNINAGLINELAESIASTSSSEKEGSDNEISDYEGSVKSENKEEIDCQEKNDNDYKKVPESDDDTNTEETDLNIRKRASIKSMHSDETSYKCLEEEKKGKNQEINDTIKNVTSQLLIQVENDNKEPDEASVTTEQVANVDDEKKQDDVSEEEGVTFEVQET